jgi:prohibitin 1
MRYTALLSIVLSGCATTIYPGEVGVRSNFGQIDPVPIGPGIVGHGPFGVRFYRVPTRTRGLELSHAVTSHRGTQLVVDASVLYATIPDLAPQLIVQTGPDFERELIDPVFRWAVQRVYSEAYATSRQNVGELIRDHMNERLLPRGVAVETVILKRSALRSDVVYKEFQARMTEEQRVEQMKHVIDREIQESERRTIEAQGQRDAYDILADSLSPEILEMHAIEIFEVLAKGRNTQVIVTKGITPLVID